LPIKGRLRAISVASFNRESNPDNPDAAPDCSEPESAPSSATSWLPLSITRDSKDSVTQRLSATAARAARRECPRLAIFLPSQKSAGFFQSRRKMMMPSHRHP
jgi:hypothetical protein